LFKTAHYDKKNLLTVENICCGTNVVVLSDSISLLMSYAFSYSYLNIKIIQPSLVLLIYLMLWNGGLWVYVLYYLNGLTFCFVG